MRPSAFPIIHPFSPDITNLTDDKTDDRMDLAFDDVTCTHSRQMMRIFTTRLGLSMVGWMDRWMDAMTGLFLVV